MRYPTIYFLVIVLLLAPMHANSQPPSPSPSPNAAAVFVHPILAAVTMLIQLVNDQAIGTATGFFFRYNDLPLLITNKHVVVQPGNQPTALRLRLHLSPDDLSTNAFVDVPLGTPDHPRWYLHSRPEVDIAVVPLTDIDLTKYFIAWTTEQDFFPERYAFEPGADVFVIGFPRGFHDGTLNLPIMRNAFVASAYGVDFRGMPFFLADANLHPGTSGSPVFTKPKSTWTLRTGGTAMVTGTPYYLLGVHSGSVSPLESGGDPLGLGVVWYARLIPEIAKQVSASAITHAPK